MSTWVIVLCVVIGGAFLWPLIGAVQYRCVREWEDRTNNVGELLDRNNGSKQEKLDFELSMWLWPVVTIIIIVSLVSFAYKWVAGFPD